MAKPETAVQTPVSCPLAQGAVEKPSALATLRNLAAKRPTPPQVGGLAEQINDPAIAGAKRDKNTVKLGADPKIMPRVEMGAELKGALEKAEADFKVVQGELRDYGAGKRKLYNKLFKADVTTVQVPYQMVTKTPDGKEEVEVKFLQVVCTNKYSVQKDTVLNNQDRLGEWFVKLFDVAESKVLKPNAEDLFRSLLGELGMKGPDLEQAMDTLFDTNKTVTTKENYEKEHEQAPQEVKDLLQQAVTRVSPGLKFT